jgi:hypothetical protein
MKRQLILAAALCAAYMLPAVAQEAEPADGSDYLAGADVRSGGQNQGRPVIGIRRKADFIVVPVSFISDSRDALVRKNEVNTMLGSAIDRAAGASLELSAGTPIMRDLTKTNYQDLPVQWAGREDTSKVDILVKVPLTTTLAEVDKRVDAFIKGLPRNGRGMIIKSTGRQVAVRNPEQYRSAIVGLIAEDVRRNAAVFGPDYRGSIDGLDKPVSWVQMNDTDVFFYLPYSYRIIAR